MRSQIFKVVIVFVSLAAWRGVCSSGCGQSQLDAAVVSKIDSLFLDTIFPAMRSAQCDLCHNDNGVASAYGITFPDRSASREQILAFGYELIEYVDLENPDQSPLLLKPTNREEHTGGVRILPGSEQEGSLKSWIAHLAKLTVIEQENAQKLIGRARQWGQQPLSVRRLTHSQYNNTVRDLLGDQSQPASRFPKEDYVRGFKNQMEAQGVSPLQAEAYSESAERLARNAFRGGDLQNLIPETPESASDTEVAEAFVRQFGLRAFRSPLSNAETEKYLRLYQMETARAGNFLAGAQLVVEVMLQSPRFLFHVSSKRVLDGREVGIGREREVSVEKTDSFNIANRLSYLLWDTMPSDEMLRTASEGGFSTPAQIESQAKSMLEDSRATLALDEFLAQWMRFDDVMGASRDRRKYREFNNELAAAMTEETRQLFRYLVVNNKNFMEFFSADYTFISSSLAQIYNLPAPDAEFSRVAYPADSGRAGVLGHGSFLVLTSKPAETSPTARGLFIRNHFLSQEIAPPPPGVNSVLPEIAVDKPMTNRQRLDVHLNSEACSSCHRLIDSVGFGFEQYDAIGRYQPKMSLKFGSRDNPTTVELDLDTQAFVQGIVDSDFVKPKELGKILASNETCQRSIVKQFFRYAFGRQETEADKPTIDKAFEKFRDSDFRFRELIIALVISPPFLQPPVE